MHNLHTHPGLIISTTDEQQPQPGEQYQLKQHPSPNSMLPPTIEFITPHAKHEPGNLMTPVSYCYPDPYFGSIVATYGAQAMVHPRVLGVQQASLPLPSDTFEEPVFVNAKQYHGILRRRQSRAKAESENKLVKCRKPYLHESRHLHAIRRARGCGGRFLNTKKEGSSQDEISEDKNLHDSIHQDPNVNKPDTEKELVAGQNGSSKTNLMTGKGIQLGNSAGSIHFGNISPTGPGNTRSVSNGIYQNSSQGQAFHSSVFHSLSVGSADNGQSGVMVAKAGHHTAVATQ